MLTYILCIFVIYVVFLVSAKIYSPFWFHQPVHHIYEIYPYVQSMWSGEPYVKRNLSISKPIFFSDFRHIRSMDIAKVDKSIFHSILLLLQGHYIDNQVSLFHINEQKIKEQLIPSSYVSYYLQEKLNQPKSKKAYNSWTIELDKTEVFGFISSRPALIYFRLFSHKNTSLHFMDLICTHEKYKQKNISRALIQTHIYNHCRTGNNVYMFKKDVELCKSVLPLVYFKTYSFVMRPIPIHKLPVGYSVKRIQPKHIDLWRSIYVQVISQFDISILPHFADTMEWLSNERYIIYISVFRKNKIEHIHGVYFFEDTNISWELEHKRPFVLRLTASMYYGPFIDPYNELIFFRGFLHSLRNVLLDKKQHGILEIPSISMNDKILARIQEKYSMSNHVDSAYYLYNMIYPKSPITSSNIIWWC